MAQSFDPGKVVLSLTIVDGHVEATGVCSVRPDVSRLLRDQPADKAVALVPLVYSLCGKAQGIAARTALMVARGATVIAHVDPEALAEAAREHAWQLLVNWPRQLGLAPDEPLFVRVVRGPTEARAELAEHLRAHALPNALRDLSTTGDSSVADLLRERVAARLEELLAFLEGRPQNLGMVTAASVAAGVGQATVATARGPLVHELTLEDDRIAAYTIVAPTDRHFAADGPMAEWLLRLRGLPTDTAVAVANRAVMAFDPCVPWICELL